MQQKINPMERGRSMIEMLAVLALIAVITITGIAGYRYAMTRYQVNEIAQTMTLASNILAEQVEKGHSQLTLNELVLTNESKNSFWEKHALHYGCGTQKVSLNCGQNTPFFVEIEDLSKELSASLLPLLSAHALTKELYVNGSLLTSTTGVYSAASLEKINTIRAVFSAESRTSSSEGELSEEEAGAICNPICDTGYVCVDNKCVLDKALSYPDENDWKRTCETTDDCQTDFVCQNNYCVKMAETDQTNQNEAAQPNGTELTEETDKTPSSSEGELSEEEAGAICDPVCGAGYVCVDNKCVLDKALSYPDENDWKKTCETTDDCQTDFVCQNNYCVKMAETDQTNQTETAQPKGTETTEETDKTPSSSEEELSEEEAGAICNPVCGAGYVCEDNKCVLDKALSYPDENDWKRTCETTDDCQVDHVCQNNYCVKA